MRISKVKISNFRCLQSIHIPFEDVSVLIGDNGVGKSSVLRALDWYFNGTQLDFPGDAFDPNLAINVEVEFRDLTDLDRGELGKYVPEGTDVFRAWRTMSPDGTERMSANSKSYPPFNEIRSIPGAQPLREAYVALVRDNPELGLPATARSRDVALEAMQAWESVHPAELEDAPADLTTNFFGIYSDGKMSKLFNFVFVSADLRAGEEMVDGRGSVLGRILAQMVDRRAADEKMAELASELKVRQDEIYKDTYGEKLDEISAKLSDAVSKYTRGKSVVFSNRSSDPKPTSTQFEVSIRDADAETPVERQGHGFQRTMLLSSLQLLSSVGGNSEDGAVICLAIEEPELFQHPVQAKAFATVLRTLAHDRSNGVQVMYATHSTYFIEPGAFHEIRRIVRRGSGSDKVRTECLFATLDDLVLDLDGYVEESVVRQQADSVTLNCLSASLFSKSTILVEGTSDQAYLEGVFERSDPLAVSGVCVANAGSKRNEFLPLAISRRLGIPMFAVFDNDSGYAARARAEGKKEATVLAQIEDNKKLNHDLLRFLGAQEVDCPAPTVEDGFAVIDDNMEEFLSNAWPEWKAEHDKLGAKEKKSAIVCKRIAATVGGRPPEVFTDIAKRAIALQED